MIIGKIKDMKSQYDFTQAIKQTDSFKDYDKFKQDLTLKRQNIIKLYDKYQQACRYGIGYLKQNPNILANDVKLIDEVLQF
jgi:hypothetical protein